MTGSPGLPGSLRLSQERTNPLLDDESYLDPAINPLDRVDLSYFLEGGNFPDSSLRGRVSPLNPEEELVETQKSSHSDDEDGLFADFYANGLKESDLSDELVGAYPLDEWVASEESSVQNESRKAVNGESREEVDRVTAQGGKKKKPRRSLDTPKSVLVQRFKESSSTISTKRFAKDQKVAESSLVFWVNSSFSSEEERKAFWMARRQKKRYSRAEKQAFVKEYLSRADNISQTEFARLKGLPRPTFSHWMRGDESLSEEEGVIGNKREEVSEAQQSVLVQKFKDNPSISAREFAKAEGIAKTVFFVWLNQSFSNEEECEAFWAERSRRQNDSREAEKKALLEEYQRRAGEVSRREFARLKGLSQSTFLRWVREEIAKDFAI